MYYYYYYYGEHTRKVTIDMTFQKPTGEKISLQEFNEFLQLINDLHRRVILVTQPEYQKKRSLVRFEEISLISYHELELAHICRENPISMKLVFSLASFSQAPYWSVWKILVEICKRYGKDTNDLQGTIESLVDYFQGLITSLRVEKIDNRIDSILGAPQYYDKLEEFIEVVKADIEAILTDKATMSVYNKFCSNAIFITDCVSTIEGFTDLSDGTIKLIEGHSE